MIFHGCFEFIGYGDYCLYPTCWSYNIIDYCIPFSWDSFLWFSNLWVMWFYPLLSRRFPVGSPLKYPSNLSKVGCFWPLWLFIFISIALYGVYHAIPHSPIKFQVDTLYMFWLDFGGSESLTTLCISTWYFLLKTSIWWGNPKLLALQHGFRMWSLMGVRVHGTILNYRFPSQYLSVFWPTLYLHTYI